MKQPVAEQATRPSDVANRTPDPVGDVSKPVAPQTERCAGGVEGSVTVNDVIEWLPGSVPCLGRKPRASVTIRTADGLAAVSETQPTRGRDVARALDVRTAKLPGHLSWLVKCGLIESTRVRGYYRRTAEGTAYLAAHAATEATP